MVVVHFNIRFGSMVEQAETSLLDNLSLSEYCRLVGDVIAKGDVFHWRNNQIVVVQSNRYASSMHSSCYQEKPRSGIWHISNVLLDKFSGVDCFTEEFIVTVAYAYSQNKLGLLLCWLHRFLL